METVKIGNVNLCYEVFGKENTRNIILISGLGSQMIRWEDSFCRLLSDQGFRVIRFDNRDSGSSVFHAAWQAPSGTNIEEVFSTLKKDEIPYSLMDMAQDVIGLFDHLKIDKAHIIGRSMGGIIAQLLGSYFPEKVITLTIIMSTSSNPSLPPPHPEVMGMMTRPSADPVTDRERYFREKIIFAEKISGTLYPLDHGLETALLEEELIRSRTKNGIIRQLLAMGSYQYNPEVLRKIKAPTLIIHGKDDLIFYPECGKDLEVSIPNSKLVMIEGMGHAIPEELYHFICTHILELIHESEVATSTGITG